MPVRWGLVKVKTANRGLPLFSIDNPTWAWMLESLSRTARLQLKYFWAFAPSIGRIIAFFEE